MEEEETLRNLLNDFSQVEGYKVLVHGGGRSATKLAAQLGIESKMVGGRRITDVDMLKVVTMVYGGLVNKNIVAGLQALGINALGLTGADMNLMRSDKRPVGEVDYGFVGDVKEVNADLLASLIHQGIVPVLAPLTHDKQGHMLNTNADTIAGEAAKALAEADYTIATWKSFAGELQEAEDILAKTDASQAEVNEALEHLQGAEKELQKVTVTLDKTAAAVYTGKTTTLKATTNDSDAAVTFKSGNTKVATVDQNGVVKGVKAGKAKITLTVQNPGDAQALVLSKDVTVKQYVTSIKLNATKKTIYNGRAFTLKATVNPKNAAYKAVTYKSSNTRYATVTSKGVVKGIKPGRVVITVTAKDGSKKVAKCTVTVKAQKATKLKISAKKTTTLKKKGASVKIKATLYPSNTYNKLIKVSSSKKGIVKLSASKIKSGKTVTVKALKKGKTVVKFTAADGSRKSAQTKVTVKK